MFIWSSEVVFDEQTKSEMQEFKRELLGDDSYVLSEEDIADELQQELEDERCNLNKTIDGVIIVFGDLGLWNGRRQGYQILGNNIANILYSQCEIAEWYGDGYNIRGRMSHHDGTNYTLYRGCVKMMHPLFCYIIIGFSFFIESDFSFSVFLSNTHSSLWYNGL